MYAEPPHSSAAPVPIDSLQPSFLGPVTDLTKFSVLLTDWRSAPGALYLRLSRAFQEAIDAGRLAPSEQLPAERTLAELLGLSRSTVVAAYDDLAATGWVTRKRGSGTHVSTLAPRSSAVLTLRTPVQRPLAPPDELDFTIAVPLLNDTQRQQMRDAALDAYQESVYHPLGLPDLRALLAQYYSRGGLPTTPEQVIVTSGAQQAISLIAGMVLRPGDSALLETPTYFGAIDVFRAAGANLIGVPVQAHGVQAQAFRTLALEHAPRLAFLTPTYQNPTGAVMPVRARQELAEFIAVQNFATIEDDTLCELDFGPPPPPRLSTFAPQAPIVNVGSVSKLFWAGLRVGWMRVPASMRPLLEQAKTLADFGGSLPAQHITLKLLQDLPTLRERRRLEVQPARDLLAGLLREHLLEWTFRVPDGGQYLWVELPTRQASSFTHHAARYGLRLFPGASMGVGDLPDSFLRLPFTLSPAQLPEAVRRLKSAWTDFQGRAGQERLA